MPERLEHAHAVLPAGLAGSALGHRPSHHEAQAYYSGFTGGVIPSEAAISAAATKKEAPQAVAVDKEFVGEVKSISSKNGYGFITCRRPSRS